MIRKAAQIDPSEVTVANSVEFRPPGSVLEEITQLGIKFVRKFGSSYALVVLHDLIDVGVNLRVKDEPPHQVRRRSIFWSSCSSEMPSDGFASRSASRRRASAMPSSSS